MFDSIYLHQSHVHSAETFQVSFILTVNYPFLKNISYRTIVTYVEEMILIFGLLCQLVIIAPPCLRIVLGPLSSTRCWWLIFFNQFLSVNFMLAICVNYLARYFYVVVYKTATICNDDFIGFFVFIEILIMGFVFALMHNMCYGKMALNYYVCIGRNPDLDAIGNVQLYNEDNR